MTGLIVPGDFVAAAPAEVAWQLGDSVHLWRLAYARRMGRAPLLALLAEYLDVDIAALELRNDDHGKPHLFVAGEANLRLHFNWSHSGDLALVALSQSVMPGVDIEFPRARARVLEIAQRFFTPAEAQTLAACRTPDRDTQFLRLWCSKEAVLKALGQGISFGLDRIGFAPRDGYWQPVSFDSEVTGFEEWQVMPLSPSPGFSGALAWRGPPRRIQAWCRRED